MLIKMAIKMGLDICGCGRMSLIGITAIHRQYSTILS